MISHLTRAKQEIDDDGREHQPSAEETLPPTDAEVAAAVRWLEQQEDNRRV